ncbi:expressed unknown protein [Seminavis robusta]|uniref:Uncharacterized protein n=1 Tax=Seminavis robusta TaxID=568900 RepID=A0A9N8H482_9STRA|nr:expressed unknown protein [Seminavis robusta]|eukprot:Sro43_g026120.1 n/a (226) ;mRNA; r:56972-57649
MSVDSHDDLSISLASFGSKCIALNLESASLASNSSGRGILKKKTVEESLSSMYLSMSSSLASLGTSVTFDSVEINEHPITLGVNPAVADGGPPIEIEWQAQSYEVTSVDDFELARAEENTASRTVRKLPPGERIDLLVKSGFTRFELERTEDEISSIRLMRQMSKRQGQREAAANASASSDSKAPVLSPSKTSRTSRDRSKAYGKLIKRFRLRNGRKAGSNSDRQ